MTKKLVFSILILTLILFFANNTSAQVNPNKAFYYNPKGVTYVPPLSKASIIYDGKLITGKKQISNLFSYLNNEQLNQFFTRYKKNKNAANVFWLVGFGLSVYSIADRVSNSDRKFNWYTFGGGLVCSAGSSYFNARANQHLLNAAIVYDKAMKKTGFIQPKQNITISLPLTK